MSALVDAFVAALPAGDAGARGDSELATVLADALARGAGAHPDIALEPARLAAYLALHADESRAPSEWLAVRNIPDVYLACAIAAGVPAAVAAFETRLVPAM